jgi:hypothetical protein
VAPWAALGTTSVQITACFQKMQEPTARGHDAVSCHPKLSAKHETPTAFHYLTDITLPLCTVLPRAGSHMAIHHFREKGFSWGCGTSREKWTSRGRDPTRIQRRPGRAHPFLARFINVAPNYIHSTRYGQRSATARLLTRTSHPSRATPGPISPANVTQTCEPEPKQLRNAHFFRRPLKK